MIIMGFGKDYLEEDPDDWLYLECYDFNSSLSNGEDDGRCAHCRKYLTLQCKRIDAFMDEIDD